MTHKLLVYAVIVERMAALVDLIQMGCQHQQPIVLTLDTDSTVEHYMLVNGKDATLH
jgi:hypothetical protein